MSGSSIAAALIALAATDADTLPADRQAAIAEALRPSLVKVEYTLQYDKGQAPMAAGWTQRCPNCGRFHYRETQGLIADERPLQTFGFLVADKQVVAPDILIHPRFIKSIAVRFNDRVQPAHPVAFGRHQMAVFLEFDEPFADARPLTFNASAEPPFLAVTYAQQNGTWSVAVGRLGKSVSITEDGRRFVALSDDCLIVDQAGKPVAISMWNELPVDDTWKGPPTKWPTVDAAALATALETMETNATNGLLHVSLNFRSPKTKKEDRWAYRDFGDSTVDETATELHVLGLLRDERTILVLAELTPKMTARLERIAVQTGAGENVLARFAHTLTDFGCLVAKLEKPLPKPMPLSEQPILGFRPALLLAADVTMQGQQRTAYYQHARIASFEIGWQGRVYPQVAGSEAGVFLCDEQGRLLALPVARRRKVTVREEWRQSETTLTPVSHLVTLLGDIEEHADPNNVPLTEAQENRLAWMGVELQGIDQNLARLNKVAHLTNDGQSGALVTYIYPDSPAAAAGVEVGDVLLRLHAEGHPKPLEVRIQRDHSSFGGFSWDDIQANEIPAEYLNQLPKPWPSAENSFTRALTELGFGTQYRAEFWHGGKLVAKEFKVVESPRHFDSAVRYKSDVLGITVRDLTYEVRRHLQKKPDDPGVIVSKVEPGGKAAVAGVIPYELITHINDKAVHAVGDFEKLTQPGGELRLSIKRQNKGRLARIRVPTTQAGPKAE